MFFSLAENVCVLLLLLLRKEKAKEEKRRDLFFDEVTSLGLTTWYRSCEVVVYTCQTFFLRVTWPCLWGGMPVETLCAETAVPEDST